MPRKIELEQERDELRAKLEKAHWILSDALGYEYEDDGAEEGEDEE